MAGIRPWRRGTPAARATNLDVPDAGELGVDSSGRVVAADGVKSWSALPVLHRDGDLPVSAAVFGAVGDWNTTTGAGTDNFTALQNWITYCCTNHKQGYLPAGNYGFAGSLIVPNVSGWALYGAGMSATYLTQITDNIPVITMGVQGGSNGGGFRHYSVSGMTLTYKNAQPATNTSANAMFFAGSAYEGRLQDIYYQRGYYGEGLASGQVPSWGTIRDGLHFGPQLTGGAINWLGGVNAVPNNQFGRVYVEANAMAGPIFSLRGYAWHWDTLEVINAFNGVTLLEIAAGARVTIGTFKLEGGTYTGPAKSMVTLPAGVHMDVGHVYIGGGSLNIAPSSGNVSVFAVGSGGGNTHLQISFLELAAGVGVTSGFAFSGADTGTSGPNRILVDKLTMNNGWALSPTSSGSTISRITTVADRNNGRFSVDQGDTSVVVAYAPATEQTLQFETTLTAPRTVTLPDDAPNTAGTQWYEVVSKGAVNGSNTITVVSGATTIATLTSDQTSVRVGWRQKSPGRLGWFVLRQGPLLSAPSGVSPVVTFYGTPGTATWTPAAGATVARIICQSGGGGAGSGSRGADGTVRQGGTGAQAGGRTDTVLPISSLGSSQTVTVGAGGTGGAAQTADTTAGSDGTSGGGSYFGNLVTSAGGSPGKGGLIASTANTGGSLGGFGSIPGAAGGNASASGGAGVGGAANAGGPAGGASGGGISTANATSAGGTGGGSRVQSTVSGGAVGAADGGSGGVAVDTAAGAGLPGASSGGGGSSRTSPGGAGGKGGRYGAGGSGGGATLNGFDSGAGGDGGQGFVMVIEW